MNATSVTKRSSLAKLGVSLLVLAAGLPAHAQLSEIRFAKGFGIPYLPVIILEEQGLVEKHTKLLGLPEAKGRFIQLASGAAMTDALISGNLEYATGGPGPLLTVWDKTRTSLNVRGIAAISSIPIYLNTINPKVKTIRDFSDADRIAVPSVKISTQAVTLQIAAEKEFGRGKHDILDKLTVSMAPPDGHNAMMSKGTEINANFTSPPFMYLQLQNNHARTVLSSYSVMEGPTTFILMWTTQKFHDANPKHHQAVLNALEEANKYIKQNPRGAAEAFIKNQKSKLDLAFVQEMIANPENHFTTAPQNLMKYADFMSRIGSLKQRPASWKDVFFPAVHDRQGS
jgi:NitT/TauT family transport system substrate-binding protein